MIPSSTMAGHYDLSFVLLSVLIAILSAYAALDLAGRITSSRTPSARFAWLGGGALAMGIGIWSMHYIGMLAFRTPMEVLYDWPTVLLSMMAAALASAIALFLTSRDTMGRFATILGSLSMGGGIAAMHYIGMAAMRMPATAVYNSRLVIVSIALAVVISFAALRITFATRRIAHGWTWRKGLSALVMGLAIPVMHYTGMAAASWSPSTLNPADLRHTINISDLGAASIALVTIVMLCLVFLAMMIDRRFSNHALELEGSEQRSRLIIAAAFDAFIGITPEGTVADWNTQAAKTFGWSSEEAIGRSIDELLRLNGQGPGTGHLLRQLMPDDGSPLEGRIEVQARHKTGLFFPAEMAISVIPVGNKKLFAAFVHDVTERKLAEQQMKDARVSAEAANRAKSEFVANMSHEIRTPLNGVIGMNDLALETELTQEQREYLETVKFSADSLLGVINDILDFSKIEAGKIELEEVGFDLRECIEATLKTLALRADEKGVELLCDISGSVPEAVSSDPSRLRQIITNLIGNAIKFTDQGEVAVKVHNEQTESSSPQLHITVSDTGIGIPKEKLEKIFEAFNQADTSTTRQYGGTGLGLTISRRLVEIMGGRIWAESTPGQGSQFHVVLPLKEAAPLVPVALPNAALQALAGVKVLIIDDNKTNRRILEGLLTRWGMLPTSAADGESALEKLTEATASNAPYRLILTDMHMPKMDGFMVVQEMQKDSHFSTSTVMMLSSGGHRGDAARCQELGIAAYLLKPVRQTELQEAIARALGVKPTKEASSMITQKSLQAERSANDFLDILLAEDNEVNQKLAVRLLEKRGHSVTVVGDGRQAVQALGSRRYDLVLMDVQMPEMDGIAATCMIREREKQTGLHQPIVAMTALVMKGDRERCLEARMDGYLSKPIRPQELDEVLETYTLRKRSRVELPKKIALQPEQMIDVPDLMARVDNDLVFIGELTEVLREDCPRKVQAMRSSLAASDGQGLRQHAHGLKGALANLSAKRAAAVAAKIEALGASGDLAPAGLLLAELEDEISNALNGLESLCKEQVL